MGKVQRCKSERSSCAKVQRWRSRCRVSGDRRQCKGAKVERWKGDEESGDRGTGGRVGRRIRGLVGGRTIHLPLLFGPTLPKQ